MWLARRLTALSTATLVVALGLASVRTGLGQVGSKSATLPPDLLKSQPFDKITLIDDTVWLVEPVSPRPLPVYDPAKAREKARAAARRAGVRPGDNVGFDARKAADEAQKAEEVREDLTIHLVEGEIRDYQIKRSSLKKIEYFEDLLMAEADRLILSNDYAKAFEHLLLVKFRDPQWKGLDERVNRLLFNEGKWALIEQDRDRGVRLLRELSARDPNYQGLADRLTQAYGGRIGEALDKEQYPYARRVLHSLETISPGNPLLSEMKARFTAKAKSLVDDALKRQGGERLERLTEALRVWPSSEGAAEKYQEAFRALPTLDVAVIDLPRPAAPWVRSPASKRVARLLYLPILANESEDAIRGKLGNQLASGLEVGDIGKRLEIRLRPTEPVWSDGTRQVGPIDIVRALSDRAQPRSPSYSARWADALERIEITDELQVTVHLNRPILKPESWLTGPIGPAHAAWDGRVSSPGGDRKPVGDGPFVSGTESEQVATYEINPVSTAAPDPKNLQRVREVRFPDAAAAVGALTRGEVSAMEHVPPDRVANLQQDPEIQVGAYTDIALHRLAVDGRTPALRSRSLRRALAYAIDRQAILEETVLRHPIDPLNAPSDGPMATGTYADASEVKPCPFDLGIARMLVVAAQIELKVPSIKLTLEYPNLPEAQAAAPRIAEMIRAAGVEIVLAERPQSDLEQSLRSGRRFDLAYRARRCVEPVTEIGAMLCPGFDAPSDSDGLSALASPRITQLLLQLEHAPEWNSAKDLVAQIDRESRDELPVVPLWQLQDHYAYRTRLKGPKPTADYLYQGIETWQIEPWYAKDPF